ncbi:MAG: hypothetical protein ACI4A8_02290 [Muribaculaceae bacterium]
MDNSVYDYITKPAMTVVLAFCSMVLMFIYYVFTGVIYSMATHTSRYGDNYFSCACDEPPILTEFEATLIGIFIMIGLMMASFFILRYMNYSKLQRNIALALFLVVDLYVAIEVREILCMPVIS